MKPPKQEPSVIDEYIQRFPTEVQARLQAMREAIRAAAPDATEKISYQIPTFHLNGNLVHFAAFANHVGFYPGPDGIAAFEKELEGYVRAKGSVQFPHGEKLPLALVKKVVKFRVGQNMAKGKKKAGKKAAR